MKDDKVILISGNQSEWFEHAIFIMKSPLSSGNKDLLAEAEKIINDYMNTGCTGFYRKKLNKYNNGTKEKDVLQKERVLTTVNEVNTLIEKKKKIDAVNVIINIALILCSILLGFMLNTIIG